MNGLGWIPCTAMIASCSSVNSEPACAANRNDAAESVVVEASGGGGAFGAGAGLCCEAPEVVEGAGAGDAVGQRVLCGQPVGVVAPGPCSVGQVGVGGGARFNGGLWQSPAVV